MSDEDYKDGLSGRPHGRWSPTTKQTRDFVQGIRDRQTIDADNKTRNKDSSTTEGLGDFLEFIFSPAGLIYLILTVLVVFIFDAINPDMSLLWGLVILIFSPDIFSTMSFGFIGDRVDLGSTFLI